MTFAKSIGLSVINLRLMRGLGDFSSTIMKTKRDTTLTPNNEGGIDKFDNPLPSPSD
jgi:hypothetical protein